MVIIVVDFIFKKAYFISTHTTVNMEDTAKLFFVRYSLYLIIKDLLVNF